MLTSPKFPTTVAFVGTLSSRGVPNINLSGPDFGGATGESHSRIYSVPTAYNTSSLGHAWGLHLGRKGWISDCRVRNTKAITQSSSRCQSAFRTRGISISLAPVMAAEAAERYRGHCWLRYLPTYGMNLHLHITRLFSLCISSLFPKCLGPPAYMNIINPQDRDRSRVMHFRSPSMARTEGTLKMNPVKLRVKYKNFTCETG